MSYISIVKNESGHLLDLVISRLNDFVSNIIICEYFFDHKTILFDLKSGKLPVIKKSTSNKDELQCLNKTYDKILRSLIDKYAPLKTRYVSDRANTLWIYEELLNEKRAKR